MKTLYRKAGITFLCWLFLFLSQCSMHQHIHHAPFDSSPVEKDKPSKSEKSPESGTPAEVELGKKIFEELKQQLEFTDNPLIQA